MQQIIRSFVLLLVLNTAAVLAFGQTNKADGWNKVKETAAGTLLIVEREKDSQIMGGLVGADDFSLTISGHPADVHIKKASVKKIFFAEWQDSKYAIRRGLILGFLAGFGLAAVREAISPSEGQDISSGLIVVFSGAVGGGIAKRRAEKPRKGKLLYSSRK